MGGRQTWAKAIPNMRQPARSARWTTWDDRPFAEGAAAARGMSWWRRFLETNAGVIPASLGVTPHCGDLERYAQAYRAPVASDGITGAKRGVVVAEACIRLCYEQERL